MFIAAGTIRHSYAVGLEDFWVSPTNAHEGERHKDIVQFIPLGADTKDATADNVKVLSAFKPFLRVSARLS